MADAMLTELYQRVFKAKAEADAATSENDDKLRQVALAKNHLLAELIDIRTEQIRRGE